MQGPGAEHHLFGDLFDGDVAAREPVAQKLLHVVRQLLQVEMREFIEMSPNQPLEAFVACAEPGCQQSAVEDQGVDWIVEPRGDAQQCPVYPGFLNRGVAHEQFVGLPVPAD
ncbi:hypothetical protein FQZ97_1070730 [compost metagenome]